MMSMTCHNLDFFRVGSNFSALGFSLNASNDRYLIRKRCNGVSRGVKNGYGAQRWFCFRQDIGTPEACSKGTYF